MKRTRLIMGMPVTVEILDLAVTDKTFADVWAYFVRVNNKYSTYKGNSEISKINQGLPKSKWSREMRAVLKLCDQTKAQTSGYFDIAHNGQLDPSGLVKGWAIYNVAKMLTVADLQNFYIDAGGDIQPHGLNADNIPWRIGIRNPFNRREIVKVVAVGSKGVATSGTYIRGQHIYNPHKPGALVDDIASLSVIGPNIYEADRFATAAFAMGASGIDFIESLDGYEAYMIDSNKRATLTSGFKNYEVKA